MVLTKRIKRIHFVGIGGSGVSSLARLMLAMGYEVTGSDISLSEVTDELRQAGAIIFEGHDARQVRHADLVIISTAIPEDNVEAAEAKAQGVPVLTRIDFLSYLAQRKFSISVSGSHGKSTTSAMIAVIFYYADMDPTIVLGGRVKHLFGSSRLGRSDYFICEGDESNNSMLRFAPRLAVVTNIDDDHLDFHKSLGNLKSSFLNFLNNPNPEGVCVFCTDDPVLRSLAPEITKPRLTYAISEDADLRAENLDLHPEYSRFTVVHRDGSALGEITLRIPGIHNVRNALAAVAVSQHCGIDFGKTAFALENFPGVARRFDRVLDREDILIIDDYAHHPTEIKALLDTVKNFGRRRLRVAFQPHRYTRSQRLAAKFPPAFTAADEVILSDIYSALEEPIEGISTEYLYSFFEREFKPGKVKVILKLPEILTYFRKTLQSGDIIVTVGAGDIFHVAYELADYLRERKMPLKSKMRKKGNGDGEPTPAELFAEHKT
mgnify:CR=1 FL=1